MNFPVISDDVEQISKRNLILKIAIRHDLAALFCLSSGLQSTQGFRVLGYATDIPATPWRCALFRKVLLLKRG